MRLFAVVGPTAAGKTVFAEELARRVGAEIVSVDSMQVFRGMDVGTAKPGPAARKRFRYHLVDVAEPEDEYTVRQFQQEGRGVIEEAERRGFPLVIAGGSGLHFRSLVDPLDFPPTDPELRSDLEARDPGELGDELLRIDPDAGRVVDMENPRRVLRAVEVAELTGETPTQRTLDVNARAVREYRPLRPFTGIGIDPGPAIAERLAVRFDGMLDDGLLDEVTALAPRMGRTARQAVGYRQLLRVVEDGEDLAAARREALRATTSLVKRQRTYFRKDPRIRWIPWHHDVELMVDDALRRGEEGAAWTS